MKPVLPLPIRELRAQAELKGLSLYDISVGSEVPYAEASRVLNGRQTSPAHLQKVSDFIRKARMPKEATA